jgi:anti-sigma B factor antagonist
MTLQIQRSFDQNKKQWDIVPKGEVDISTATIFRSALEEAYKEEKGNIVLHFDQLRYMDSTGLGVIIGAYSRMKDNGDYIVLRNPRENIQKLLRITNLDKLLCPELCE